MEAGVVSELALEEDLKAEVVSEEVPTSMPEVQVQQVRQHI